MKHGFVKVAVATPTIKVADPSHNVTQLIRLTSQADDAGVQVLVFPELSLCGYTAGDLLFSQKLLHGVKTALVAFLSATKEKKILTVLGLPWEKDDKLYNAAAICFAGELLAVIPKTALPNYGAFSEGRYFASAEDSSPDEIDFNGTPVPFGTDLLLSYTTLPSLKIAVEIGEDLTLPCPPSSYHATAGATLICNLCATPEIVGAAEKRRQAVTAQSLRTLSAYMVASAGDGESTTDTVFGGHNLIAECGTLLAEQKPFAENGSLLITEIDVERLSYERRRNNTYKASMAGEYRLIPFSLPITEVALTRAVNPNPFVPVDPAALKDRCEQILSIAAHGLKTRIQRAYAKKIVVGISGGLDSTLALLTMVRAMDLLARPRTDIIAVTMPCFGTTKRTKNNATVLCEELGVDFRCVDIFEAVNVHFKDIGHDPESHNVTYENAQARERTQVLMDIANECGGMVIGTGDLSELALGWATYNGDHMSMYGVNADIPKTLIRHVVAYCATAEENQGHKKAAAALRDILDTPVSPELLPATKDGSIAQKTEDLVGPYEIHDFYLYYTLRFGFSPEKLYRLAQVALGNTYDEATLKKWLNTFVRRFFSQQFKRSCLPDGPKVGSVGLSPRGDWKMPSDASAALWIEEAENL
ncbi:MAG: NAD(+) synthase [Clostridia bacterium]|nr:NAD(+) synthase [Clostridia bacterium]